MSAALQDIVDLSFRDDLDLLFSRWLRGVDDAEVRQGYEAALALAAPRRARYWLLDMRRRGMVSTTATRWVMEAFLPRLVTTLGGQVYLAYLISPAHQSELPSLTSNARPVDDRCRVQVFTDECSAMQWLEQSRQLNIPHAQPAATTTST
ncbi:hypothetical protein [Solirubrum puertoriconensis]|uniref:STAS/SEC14 domain-containing protein n=1 Tax=Solirubrum puertoriconensis TaxID=1751427 RepID=A0A9X0HI65_SOLP1|nr:hypothetical protein [Solirubrum puertoriconensis]KUG06326.1 hypothetical protein ASU33_02920 [Solirubrum puertoriconensis]